MVRVSLITRKLFFLLYHAQSRGRPPDFVSGDIYVDLYFACIGIPCVSNYFREYWLDIAIQTYPQMIEDIHADGHLVWIATIVIIFLQMSCNALSYDTS